MIPQTLKPMPNLAEELRSVINPSICDEATYKRFLERLDESGGLVRDENPQTHYSCYFLVWNPATKKILIVHHKKSGLWLSPGGHIDQGETLMQTLNREVEEELGVKGKVQGEIKPFLLTVTPIENATQSCKEHLDIWYRIESDGSDFNIDSREFHTTLWLTPTEARELVTDPPNLRAIELTEELMK